jgi:GntR family transcriptional regulator, transcriptional repressor for pyruvate dehydrogenase complex
MSTDHSDEAPTEEVPTAHELGPLAVEKIRPAYRQVADQLRTNIVTGVLLPGQRLPIEPELAKVFGVSRSTIREALGNLTSSGLVVTRRGVNGGTWVAVPSTDQIKGYLTDSIGMMMHAETLSDEGILEARLLLEVPVAGLAAQRRSDDQLSRLAADVVRGKASEAEHRSRGRSFHLTLLEAAGNPLLDLMARPIFDVLTTRYVARASSPAFWKKVNHEHRLIHEAVLDGDAKTAELTMHEHVHHLNSVYQKIDH